MLAVLELREERVMLFSRVLKAQTGAELTLVPVADAQLLEEPTMVTVAGIVIFIMPEEVMASISAIEKV